MKALIIVAAAPATAREKPRERWSIACRDVWTYARIAMPTMVSPATTKTSVDIA
jgi:hypothetical protein